MGYTLKIGELIQTQEEFDGIPYLENNVILELHSHLPKYDEPTDQENQRWPSYSAWHDFTEFCNLKDLMDILIDEHPGVVHLKKEHLDELELKYNEFMKKYPNAIAGYSPNIDHPNGIHEDLTWPPENSFLVRLDWMKYWMTWALKNCKTPVFYNS